SPRTQAPFRSPRPCSCSQPLAPRTRRAARRRTLTPPMRRPVITLVAAAALLTGCSSSATNTAHGPGRPKISTTAPASTDALTTLTPTTPTAVRKTFAPGTFDTTNALLEERVRSAGLSGGMIRIAAADGTVIHERTIGGVSGATAWGVASSTKWFTAATFMTFVDRGAIALDDAIAPWLPEFAGSGPAITARQLLDHTSGVHDNPCQDNGSALAACVRTLASSPREFAAGTAFSYGNAPFLVVGRLVEVLGGADFASVVGDR